MGGGFDTPVCADGVGRDLGGEGMVGEIEGGLGRIAKLAAGGTAGEHVSFDPDDGPDVIFPVGAGKLIAWFEDRDGAAFDAVTALVVAGGCIERCGGYANILRLRMQGGLIVFELDDQGDICGAGGLEEFF
jgi:hypothetical protein